MSTVVRHIFTSVVYSLLIALFLLIVTFLAFPLDEISLLWEKEIGNVSFLIWIFGIIIVCGTIFGISVGLYWNQRLQRIEKKLSSLSQGEIITNRDDPDVELAGIQKRILQIQERMQQQTEYSQKLVSERAMEREKSLQEIVVQERNRLARELHDSVSQQLFAASMMMSAINDPPELPKIDELKKKLQLVENMIQQSQLEMRALLLHLRPVALKGKSLQAGIEELLVEMKQKVPMEITWTMDDFSADKGIEDQLFRIVQEAMSNTLRHAEATSFHVLLIIREGNIILRISDNGIGFDLTEFKTGSYGIENMKERAIELGGTFKVVSLPNEGTRVDIKVPLYVNEERQISEWEEK